MSSLGEFLNAMVELRKNKAQVAEYNASQQAAGMEALGKGFGGLLSGLGTGMETRQNNALANQLYNRANPPRAQAVDQSLQAGADTTVLPGQTPYDVQPMTAGGPFTGGVAGLKTQGMLDTQALNQFKADTSRQGMIDRNIHAGESLDLKTQIAAAQEAARNDRIAQADQREKDKLAMNAMGQATDKYQGDVKNAHAHNTGMTAALSQAAGAKTQADWEKAVTVITGLYQAGTKQGFKDLPYPQIPPSPDQKAAAATAVTTAAGQDTWHWYNPGSWGNPSPADIAAQQQTAQQNVPTYGGPADYEMAPEPTAPSTRPQDYYPAGPAAPTAAPQGQPATTQSSGYASPVAVRDALKAGTISQDQAKQILKSQFGFE